MILNSGKDPILCLGFYKLEIINFPEEGNRFKLALTLSAASKQVNCRGFFCERFCHTYKLKQYGFVSSESCILVAK